MKKFILILLFGGIIYFLYPNNVFALTIGAWQNDGINIGAWQADIAAAPGGTPTPKHKVIFISKSQNRGYIYSKHNIIFAKAK